MTTSSRIDASGAGNRSLAVFARFSAVFVGLANLTVLTVLSNSDYSAWRSVTWTEALPFVIAVVVAGLVTSEIFLGRFKPLALKEEFFDRYRVMVGTVCLGGVVSGGLVGGLLLLGDLPAGGSLTITGLVSMVLTAVPVVLLSGFFGALYGAALGFIEGLFLAFPLAAILGRMRNGS